MLLHSCYHCLSGADNVALNKPAFQSSLWEDDVASRAVDGDWSNNLDDQHCAHTLKEPTPWWAADLGAQYKVERVVLVNRNSHREYI